MAAAMPTHSDLNTYITGLGVLDDVTVITEAARTAAVNAAIEQFERATGWQPFLSGADTTRYFDPPGHDDRGQTRGGGRTLDLRGGLVTLTTLKVDYSTTNAGTAQTVNVDFFPAPRNPAEGWPYTAIEFVETQRGDPRSIEIVGAWGFAATVPDDAWEAILHRAAHICLPQIGGQKSKGINFFQTPNLSVQYGKVLDAESKVWVQGWRSAVRHYRRVSL